MVERISGGAQILTKSEQEDLGKRSILPWESPFQRDTIAPTSSPLNQAAAPVASQPTEKVEKGGLFDIFRSFWTWMTGSVDEETKFVALTKDQIETIEKICHEMRMQSIRIDEIPQEVSTELERMMKLYREMQELKGEAIRVQAKSYQLKKEELDQKRNEIKKEWEQLAKDLAKNQWWQKLSLIVAPLQAAGIALTCSTGVAAAIIVLSLVVAADQLSEGKGREMIAKAMAGNDTISQENIEYRLEVASTLLTIGLALFGAQSPEKLAQIGAQISALNKAGSIYLQKSINDTEGNLIKLRYDQEKAEKGRTKAGSKLVTLEEQRLELLKKFMNIFRGEAESAIALIRA